MHPSLTVNTSLPFTAAHMSAYQTPTTRDQVRAYVLSESTAQARAAQTVLLNVTHSNLKSTRFAELRMDVRTRISDVKQRLYLHTGTRPAFMTLLLRSPSGQIRAQLSDETAVLGAYDVHTGDTLHIEDDDAQSASAHGWLEDVSLVPRYVLSDEAYDKKEGTYRKFKQRMREKDPAWSATGALARREDARRRGAEVDFARDAPPDIALGVRVEVTPGGKRGCVRFVGNELVGLPEGWWVGVCYDEPVGKNDGMVKGVRYFQTQPAYGGFVRPSNVRVGDFSVRAVDESEDEI